MREDWGRLRKGSPPPTAGIRRTLSSVFSNAPYIDALKDAGVDDYSAIQLLDSMADDILLVLPLNVYFGAQSSPADATRREVLERYFSAIEMFWR